MEFHSWQSLLDESRLIYSECKGVPLGVTWRIERKRIADFDFQHESNRTKRLLRIDTEYEWEKSGRPFYNVQPNIVPAISKTNLSGVPANLIEVPNNYPAVAICFAKGEEPIGLQSLFFARLVDGYLFVLDYGIRQSCRNVSTTFCSTLKLSINGCESMPEAFDRHLSTIAKNSASEDDRIEVVALEEMKDHLLDSLRIAVTIGFLANQNDGLVVRDVLSKDRSAYRDALQKNDSSERSAIEDRAARRGKLGWNVGTSEFAAPWFAAPPPKPQFSVRGPHTRAHIRTGHFRAVRFGAGRTQVKVKWFRPTVVRPDLPFSSANHLAM